MNRRNFTPILCNIITSPILWWSLQAENFTVIGYRLNEFLSYHFSLLFHTSSPFYNFFLLLFSFLQNNSQHFFSSMNNLDETKENERSHVMHRLSFALTLIGIEYSGHNLAYRILGHTLHLSINIQTYQIAFRV